MPMVKCATCGETFYADAYLIPKGQGKYCSKKCAGTKHGMTGTKLHVIWVNMRERCDNKNRTDYERYGGRGTVVCKEWYDFVAFRDWALLNGYADWLEIDRKDTKGNYCPENCRFVTRTQNSQNRGKKRNQAGTMTSKYKGVWWNKRSNKWQVSLSHDNIKIHGGYFHTEIGAAKRYDILAKQYHGEFAHLNFPDGDAK